MRYAKTNSTRKRKKTKAVNGVLFQFCYSLDEETLSQYQKESRERRSLKRKKEEEENEEEKMKQNEEKEN